MTEWNLFEGAFSDLEGLRHWLMKKTGVREGFQVDSGGLLWKSPETASKTLVLFRLLPNAVMVKSVADEHCKMLPLGSTKTDAIGDMVCDNGVLRIENENEVTMKPFSKATVGDVYHIQPKAFCKGEMLYGSQLGTLVSLELMAFCIEKSAQTKASVAVAAVNETVFGAESVCKVIMQQKPDSVIVCSMAEAEKSFVSGNGPGVGIKDGHWAAERNIWGQLLDFGLETQSYVGNTGDTLAQCYLALKNKHLAGIYLPVVKQGSRVEEIHGADIEKTKNLLLKSIDSFDIMDESNE